MGKMQRDKGARFEREIVNWHKEQGIHAERVPLSGAAKGSFGSDIIVTLHRTLNIEAKKRATGTGFQSLYNWFEQDDADILVVGKDRARPLYVLTEETYLEIAHLLTKGIDKTLVKSTYGSCPLCGADGIMRERRPDGNDTCTNGHVYPSSKAIEDK